ncbi:hypothetical protein IHQ71_28265 [Rhizobium sp. TH2]|uniref:hypothetical protein n=1 Tax=Rhizobium sp. TH2 TaxID=2775403 RepID=UPI002157A63A|nr:hypothetical protein [Rhizobium sp. TH2]UVC08963.1 hypothetical protein IHQ71_28265 [Rhizobium sp. TH2]
MAKRFQALNDLWQTVREASHDFRASTDIFPSFNVQQTAKTLELQAHGVKNGTENRPTKAARGLDEVEQRIVSQVEDEKKTSYQTLVDQFNLFSDRIRSLDFEGQFSMIRQVNASTFSEFKAAASEGVDQLHGLRRDLTEAEDEMDAFKKRHKLERAAKVSSGAHTGFKVSLIVFLLLLETVLNGSFLAKGSEQGILGGVTEAVTFAVINIGSALLLAFWCVRWLLHRNYFLKFLGLIGLLTYIGIAVFSNLALAHYREVSAVVVEGASQAALAALWANPVGLKDLSSWTLFGMGLIASLIAFIDGCLLTDPYPGYSGVQSRLDRRRSLYVTRRSDLINELRDVRDDHNEKVEEIIRDLNERRAEGRAIIHHRALCVDLFKEHQNQLERALNALLTIYRDANRAARTEEEPRTFSTPYKMDRIAPLKGLPDEWNDAELSKKIDVAQNELTEQIKQIRAEFELAIERYHQLDNLFPEGTNGQTQAQTA